VRCSNCGICCEETMMELSNRDIEKLVEMGYCIEDFEVVDNSVIRLRNIDGYCYFYNQTDNKCQIYENRPIGCFLYPIVYLANKGPIIDELCPMGHTISEQELRTKGKILNQLLKTIDNENALTRAHTRV
jgi:Fe-S-cluster containining protein